MHLRLLIKNIEFKIANRCLKLIYSLFPLCLLQTLSTVEVITKNEGMHILVTVTAITISFHNFLEENALLPPTPPQMVMPMASQLNTLLWKILLFVIN